MERKKQPEYGVWRDMRRRCSKPYRKEYADYGARGISVCERWDSSYEAFIADVGRRPTPKHSIERIDNDGNYEPGNVRWATRTEQNRNSRHNKLTFDLAQEVLGRLEHGEPTASVARRIGITCAMVYHVRTGHSWRELPPFMSRR